MSDDVKSVAHKLGAQMGKMMVDDEYYADVGPDELEDVVDDAWMMGGTQDSLVDSGFDIHDDPDVRRAAHKAFSEGFLSAFGD